MSATSKVSILGKFYSAEMRDNVSETSGEGIFGTINVQVGESIIPVRVGASKYKRKKNPNDPLEENSNYTAIVDVLTKGISITDHPDEAPSYIGFSDLFTELRENFFMPKNGKMIFTNQISGSFPRIYTSLRPNDGVHATFDYEGIVQELRPEVDSEGQPTGSLVVKIITPSFRDVDLLSFVIKNAEGVTFAQSTWIKGTQIHVAGEIERKPVEKIIKQNVLFGDPVEKKITSNVTEYIIKSVLSNNATFNEQSIGESFIKRKARIEETGEKKTEKPVAKSAVPNYTDFLN